MGFSVWTNGLGDPPQGCSRDFSPLPHSCSPSHLPAFSKEIIPQPLLFFLPNLTPAPLIPPNNTDLYPYSSAQALHSVHPISRFFSHSSHSPLIPSPISSLPLPHSTQFIPTSTSIHPPFHLSFNLNPSHSFSPSTSFHPHFFPSSTSIHPPLHLFLDFILPKKHLPPGNLLDFWNSGGILLCFLWILSSVVRAEVS